MKPAGQQWVVGEIEAWNDVRSAKGDLLRLGEEIVGVAIQDHFPDGFHRHQFLRHDLGGVQHVEAETLGLFLRENLQAELVFRVGSRFNCLSSSPRPACSSTRPLDLTSRQYSSSP